MLGGVGFFVGVIALFMTCGMKNIVVVAKKVRSVVRLDRFANLPSIPGVGNLADVAGVADLADAAGAADLAAAAGDLADVAAVEELGQAATVGKLANAAVKSKFGKAAMAKAAAAAVANLPDAKDLEKESAEAASL